MALLTMAMGRKLQRIHPKRSLPFLLHSVTQPSIPTPSTARQIKHSCQTFYQTPLVLFLYPFRNPHFSTLRASHHLSLHETIDFSQVVGEILQNEPLGVHELVKELKKADQFSSVKEAITSLDGTGVEPNEELVFWAIWALRDDWKLAFLVFKWGEKRGCLGENVWVLMIWVLGNYKKFNTAWCLIRDLHQSSMDTRRAMLVMIDRYAVANNPSRAIQTFQMMEKFRTTPDIKAFDALLKALCKQGYIEEAEEFMHLEKKLFPLETDSFNIILNGWCNICVDVSEAKRIWREMSKHCILPNEASYMHMISCFSKVGNLFDSLRLYDEMKKRGWVPGLEVFNSLIYVLTCENCLQEALRILDKMKEVGVQPNSSTYNSIIRPLCEAKKIDEGRNIFATMIRDNISPTIETYHSFLEGVTMDRALEILEHMKRAGLGPNRVTFLLIFGKFFKLKQPENALKFWAEMKQYEVAADSAHYIVLVEGLVTCGMLIKAREIYDDMKVNGFLDDPKLKKLLEEPVQNSSQQREKVPFRVVRSIKKETQFRSSLTSRRKHGKKPRRKRNVT